MDLRWGVLLVGLAVFALVYFYSRYRPKNADSFLQFADRQDPALVGGDGPAEEITGMTDVPAIPEPADALLMGSNDSGGDDSGVNGAGTEVEVQEEAEAGASRIVAIRLMSGGNGGFPADKLILALREAGLRYGQFGIFHRPHAADENRPDFSVANLIEPGTFDLTRMKKDYYPGVSVFLMLPGPENSVEAFDDMLTTSRSLADKLGGELLDEQGSTLSIQRERYLREEVVQFQHQVK